MNHYYLEQRSKEKISELQAEGLRSQAYYSSRPARESLLHRLQRLILGTLGSRESRMARSVKSTQTETTYSEF